MKTTAPQQSDAHDALQEIHDDLERVLRCFCGDPAAWPEGMERCATCGKVRSCDDPFCDPPCGREGHPPY